MAEWFYSVFLCIELTHDFKKKSAMNLWPNFDLKFDPILQGKKGKNKPENPQNKNMAKIAPKSDKFTK